MKAIHLGTPTTKYLDRRLADTLRIGATAEQIWKDSLEVDLYVEIYPNRYSYLVFQRGESYLFLTLLLELCLNTGLEYGLCWPRHFLTIERVRPGTIDSMMREIHHQKNCAVEYEAFLASLG